MLLVVLSWPAAAAAAEPPVRVEVVSRSQGAVAKSNKVRVRVAAPAGSAQQSRAGSRVVASEPAVSQETQEAQEAQEAHDTRAELEAEQEAEDAAQEDERRTGRA